MRETLKKIREKLFLSDAMREEPSASSKKEQGITGGNLGGKAARNRIQGNEIFTKFERPAMIDLGDQEEGG